MNTDSVSELRDSLKRQGVKYCVGAYVDIHGVPKGKFVPIDHFEDFAARGISELPRTLDEAVAAFAADPFVEKTLGKELRDELITYKSEEWRQYHQRVSQWEIDTYARLF